MKVYDIEGKEHFFAHSVDAKDAIESGHFFGSEDDAKKAVSTKAGHEALAKEKVAEPEKKRARRQKVKAEKKGVKDE